MYDKYVVLMETSPVNYYMTVYLMLLNALFLCRECLKLIKLQQNKNFVW